MQWAQLGEMAPRIEICRAMLNCLQVVPHAGKGAESQFFLSI
jgi:hypothetical protein